MKIKKQQKRPTSPIDIANLPTSYKEAVRVGSPFYFTGVPCPMGHVIPRNTKFLRCDACAAEHTKQYKERRKKNEGLDYKKERLIESAKHRSKVKGVPFDITADDLEWPTHCPVLGIKLNYWTKNKPKHDTASLDRVIPALGYVKGNVKVISHKANSLKRDGNLDELLKVVAYVFQHLDKEEIYENLEKVIGITREQNRAAEAESKVDISQLSQLKDFVLQNKKIEVDKEKVAKSKKD